MSSALAWSILHAFNWLVLAYFIAVNSVYLLTSIFAFRGLTRYARRLKALDAAQVLTGDIAPPVTLLAPAYNEEQTCVDSVRALLTLIYPDYEIMVINDGSQDGTLARLQEAYALQPAARLPTAALPAQAVRGIYRSARYPQLWVIDKENGGKADALNVGVSFCRTPLFCALDADTLLERESLLRIVRPFVEDTRVVATGGIIRIVNGCTVRDGLVRQVGLPRSWLARFQVMEYLRAFLAGRMGWDAVNATFIISGAFGVFRRDVVVCAGGYTRDTVGEDVELVVRLHRYCREQQVPYRIGFVPDPVAWTECPEKFAVLRRQRDRWQRGLTETLARHRRMLFNPRYGGIGLIAFPYFYFLEMLGPVIEFLGYVVFAASVAGGIVTPHYALAFFMVAFVLGAVLSLAAVGLEELTLRRYQRLRDVVLLFALALVENFGYRQLINFWRLQGIVSALLRRKGWGRMTRRGFGT
ncbi:MAG TPA: glycosyltransferase [bacterium]|nr:glycosyltransferase [bacterium]